MGLEVLILMINLRIFELPLRYSTTYYEYVLLRSSRRREVASNFSISYVLTKCLKVLIL